MRNLILIIVAVLCLACDKKSDQEKLSDETIEAIAGRWHSARYAEDENFTVNVTLTSADKECFAGNVIEFKKDGTFKEIRSCENGKAIIGRFKIKERDILQKNSIWISLYNPVSDKPELEPHILLCPRTSTSDLFLYKYTDSALIFYVRDAPEEWFYEFKRVQ